MTIIGQKPSTTQTITPHDQFNELLNFLGRGGKFQYYWAKQKGEEGRKKTFWFPYGNIPSPPMGWDNIYFGVHPTNVKGTSGERAKSKGERATIVSAANCLFGDFDTKHGNTFETVQKLTPPPSVIISTGGGWHCYWLLKDPVVLSNGNLALVSRLQEEWVARIGSDPGAKTLAQVLRVPGTNNGKYMPARPVEFIKCDFGQLYDLKSLEGSKIVGKNQVKTVSKRRKKPQSRDYRIIPLGSRNTSLTSFGGMLRRLGKERDEIKTALDNMNAACENPLPETEVDGIVDSVSKYARGYSMDDDGNAERFVDKFGNLVRHSNSLGWLIWDGARWAVDKENRVRNLLVDAMKDIYLEAAAEKDANRQLRLATWSIRSRDLMRINHALDLAGSKDPVSINMDRLDANPWLLNCKNGTLDLRTGMLRPHDPADLITKIVDVNYEPKAMCPRWTKFLGQIMNNNVGLINFLQQAVGYSLTGRTTEQCLFLMYGQTGSNGKSTFLETITRLLGGEYAIETPTDTIVMRQFGDGIPNDVARMKGARLVHINEIEKGKRLAVNRIKQMTGGDTMTARFMRGEWFDFVPEFKIWIRANHRPNIIDTDNAIWRRIKQIPFEVEIPLEKQDPDLLDSLAKEREGILAWAVKGCLTWQKTGRLVIPVEVQRSVAEYRSDMDIFGQFFQDRVVLKGSIGAAQLFLAYKQWCEENGERYPLHPRQFKEEVTRRGCKARHTHNGTEFFGVSLNT